MSTDAFPPLFGCRYHTDPSGTFLEYQAHAIGNGSEGAHTILKDNYDSVTATSRPS